MLEDRNTNDRLKSIIQSILFATSDFISLDELSTNLGINKDLCEKILEDIKNDCDRIDSGFRLIEANKTYQYSTKPENYEYIIKFINKKNEKNLSKAALETLSIIAYKQPVTKIEVEKIRGVKCDSSIKALLELGLIDISGTLDTIGHPNLYITTNEFLKKFGIKKIEDLPKIEE